MKAIQAALRKGVHIIPCTGRVYNMIPPQLLSQEGIRYYVTCHGARVYDCINDETLYEDVIPAEHASQLMRLLENKGLYNEIAANNTIYFEKSVTQPFDMSVVPVHHIWYLKDECYTAIERPSEYFAKHGVSVEKMNIYGIPEDMQQSVYDALNATGYIKHTRLGAGPNLEFSSRTLDKLRATDVVLKKLGISYEETLAIGDSSSDFEIIKACGIGVAMGNAPDNIKAVADYVTDINTENGLAHAFEKYVL